MSLVALGLRGSARVGGCVAGSALRYRCSTGIRSICQLQSPVSAVRLSCCCSGRYANRRMAAKVYLAIAILTLYLSSFLAQVPKKRVWLIVLYSLTGSPPSAESRGAHFEPKLTCLLSALLSGRVCFSHPGRQQQPGYMLGLPCFLSTRGC
jgi:hypothetical protein